MQIGHFKLKRGHLSNFYLEPINGGTGLTLKPGQTAVFILQMNVPEDAPLAAQFSFRAAVTSDQSRISVPISVTVASDANVNLTVVVEDEFSYFADGRPKVGNATVRIINYARGIDQELLTSESVSTRDGTVDIC